jgi:hypothetical protein
MCKKHWFMVPPSIRDKVNAHSDEYVQAITAAQRIVQEKEQEVA